MTARTADQLHRPNQRGAMTLVESPVGAGPFAGVATIASGAVTAVVSTTVVKSNSMVFITADITSPGVWVNSHGGVHVNSLVDGVSFAIGSNTGVGVALPFDVNWEIKLR